MVNTFINCSSLRTWRIWRRDRLRHLNIVNTADHAQSCIEATTSYCRRNGGGMSACGRNWVPIKHRLLDANICTMSPTGRWLRFLAESHPPTTFFVLFETDTKNVLTRWGQPVKLLRPSTPLRRVSRHCVNTVIAVCRQGAKNTPSVCRQWGNSVKSMCLHCDRRHEEPDYRATHQSLTATLVAPPCCVTRGLHRSLTAPFEKDSSVALLDQT